MFHLLPLLLSQGATPNLLEALNSIAGIAGLITAVVSILVARSQIKKTNADASEVITKAATSLVEPLERKITKLETEMSIVSDENVRLKARIAQVEDQNGMLIKAIIANIEVRQRMDMSNNCMLCRNADDELTKVVKGIQFINQGVKNYGNP